MIPITLENDRLAIEAALKTIGLTEPQNARVIQISDTLHLDIVRVSEACLKEINSCGHKEITEELAPMPLSPEGKLANL